MTDAAVQNLEGVVNHFEDPAAHCPRANESPPHSVEDRGQVDCPECLTAIAMGDDYLLGYDAGREAVFAEILLALEGNCHLGDCDCDACRVIRTVDRSRRVASR